MTTSTNAPLVGRRNPGIRGDFDLLCRSYRTAALTSTRVADRRFGAYMIAEQLDAADPQATFAAYLDDAGFSADAWRFPGADAWTHDDADDDDTDAWFASYDETDGLLDACIALDNLIVDTHDEIDALVAGSPAGWGSVFDPDDVQWGFTVRTRF